VEPESRIHVHIGETRNLAIGVLVVLVAPCLNAAVAVDAHASRALGVYVMVEPQFECMTGDAGTTGAWARADVSCSKMAMLPAKAGSQECDLYGVQLVGTRFPLMM
jgi:hypothetical protein